MSQPRLVRIMERTRRGRSTYRTLACGCVRRELNRNDGRSTLTYCACNEAQRMYERPPCKVNGCLEPVEKIGPHWRTVCAAHRKRAQRGQPVTAPLQRRG